MGPPVGLDGVTKHPRGRQRQHKTDGLGRHGETGSHEGGTIGGMWTVTGLGVLNLEDVLAEELRRERAVTEVLDLPRAVHEHLVSAV